MAPPMQQMAPTPEAETPMEEAAPGKEMDTGATELCIKIDQDGTISVYKETGADETAEESAQPVADIGAALAWVLKTYKGLGNQGAASQFQAGFGGGRPAQGPNPMAGVE